MASLRDGVSEPALSPARFLEKGNGMRIGLTAAALVFLTACQTVQKAPNPVGMDVLSDYTVSEINVVVPATTKIWWGEAEREFAASLNCAPPTAARHADEARAAEENQPDCDYDSLIETPEAKEYLRERVTSLMHAAAETHYANALPGEKPAILTVNVSDVYVVSGGQAVMVGGAHRMAATFKLSDATTDAVIVNPSSFDSSGGYAPGGLLAVMVEAASDPAPVRMADDLASQSRAWMLNEAPR